MKPLASIQEVSLLYLHHQAGNPVSEMKDRALCSLYLDLNV